MWWEKFQKEILDAGLYNRSGTEVGLSDGILVLEEKEGDYYPKKISEKDIPETAYKAACDRYINYPRLNKFIFGRLPKNWLVGVYEKIFIGHCADERVRRNGSSGGIASAVQLYLLENGLIDGAVTLRMRKDKPYLTEPIIAVTREEILEGAQSKYIVAPINQILAKLPGDFNSIVYIGLPEAVAAIRKLKEMRHPAVRNINYILGLFHGETIKFEAIASVLRAHGAGGAEKIKSLAFREGEWPGNLRIELENGRVISIRKFHANYLIPSHITEYSLYQVDYMNELADISLGDAWAPKYEERGEGWSVIIARTPKGLDLLTEMHNKQIIHLEEISEEELIKMHSHGLDFKKRGAFIRIEERKKRGLPVPEYGYEPINIPFSRKWFEKILGLLFCIFQAKTTIWLLEHISPRIIGWVFVKARNLWKKRTKKTKRGGLSELKFRILN